MRRMIWLAALALFIPGAAEAQFRTTGAVTCTTKPHDVLVNLGDEEVFPGFVAPKPDTSVVNHLQRTDSTTGGVPILIWGVAIPATATAADSAAARVISTRSWRNDRTQDWEIVVTAKSDTVRSTGTYKLHLTYFVNGTGVAVDTLAGGRTRTRRTQPVTGRWLDSRPSTDSIASCDTAAADSVRVYRTAPGL